MGNSLESSASRVRKANKEHIISDTVVPESFKTDSVAIMTLLKDYYKFLGLEGQPSHEIASILEARNVETADEKYLEQIKKEIAKIVPNIKSVDKRFLFKGITNYYKLKGSIDSIEIFFKVLLLDDVEISYPYEKVLIPSDGRWDADVPVPVYNEFGIQIGQKYGTFLNNKGFLSDDIYLQDSYFYQKFSYVIRTGTNQSKWGLPFAKLVHPAGFIFFSEILLLLYGLNGEAKMPLIQPGFIGAEDVAFIIELFGSGEMAAHPAYTELVKDLLYSGLYDNNLRSERRWSELLKFYDTTGMYAYDDNSIEDIENNNINRNYNVGSIITITGN